MDEKEILRGIARARNLRLLVLFGSRARGDHTPGSDWDLAYEGDPDELALSSELSRVLGTERVDLVRLDRAGALLRFRAAREGVPLHEASPGLFRSFQAEAALVWCDMGPVVEEAYRDLLERL